jgi:hypothetical protein
MVNGLKTLMVNERLIAPRPAASASDRLATVLSAVICALDQMHPIDTLYQEHSARRRLPSRELIEQHTSGVTDEDLARAIAGRLELSIISAAAPRALAVGGRGHRKAARASPRSES